MMAAMVNNRLSKSEIIKEKSVKAVLLEKMIGCFSIQVESAVCLFRLCTIWKIQRDHLKKKLSITKIKWVVQHTIMLRLQMRTKSDKKTNALIPSNTPLS